MTRGSMTIVAPAAPGGGWDQTAREMQRTLSAIEPGLSVQVENVAGAAGTIGLARFVTADRGNPDALLVVGLVMVSGIVTNGAPVSLADTTPIARLTGEFEVIVVPSASPIHTLSDLITAFRASPSAVSWGGGSAGGTDDLLVRLIAEAVGTPPVAVNYIAFSGGGAALAALLGGQITAGVSGYGEFAGQIEAGTLRLLAVSAPARVAGIAAPTLREQGVDLDLANWRGVVAPPGLTDAERDTVTARVERMASSEVWRATLARNGWTDLLLTGTPFRQFLQTEQRRVESVLRRLGSDAARGANGISSVTPMSAPYTALVMFCTLAIANVIAWRRRGANRGRATGTSVPLFTLRAGALTAALIAHAIVFPRIGFVEASTALFAACSALFGSRRWVRDVAIGFATATVLYVVFTFGLGLTLPTGPVSRWLRG